MTSLEEVRERWIREKPRYEGFLECVTTILTNATRQRGIVCHVSGRTKDVGGFIKKAYSKSYRSPWRQTTDKAGARVVVLYRDDAARVSSIIEHAFDFRGPFDKATELKDNLLGYRGVHYDVRLKGEDLAGRTKFRGLRCEVQVNTAPERAWADVSHELIYKPAQGPALEARRTINLLMALVELFDDHVARTKTDIMNAPGFREAAVLDILSTKFHAFDARRFNRELSMEVIGALMSLYSDDELAAYDELMSQFVDSNRSELQQIYGDYANDDRHPLLLFQPESLLVFERLEKDRFQLRDAWEDALPLEFLEKMASVWGVDVT